MNRELNKTIITRIFEEINNWADEHEVETYMEMELISRIEEVL